MGEGPFSGIADPSKAPCGALRPVPSVKTACAAGPVICGNTSTGCKLGTAAVTILRFPSTATMG